MMNKEEFIKKFIDKLYDRLDEMPLAFREVNSSDKKHMENGFNFAITNASQLLGSMLDESDEKKPINKFREFVDKKLGLSAPTEADIEREKAKVEMEKQKLEIAKLRAEQDKLRPKKTGGSSSISNFVANGVKYDPFTRK